MSTVIYIAGNDNKIRNISHSYAASKSYSIHISDNAIEEKFAGGLQESDFLRPDYSD